ncbi:YaaL family protein [Siminovitchia sediminis]|uniref:YaaL family protein n=1 Tax=Siminovitchia sediminis TaxID=1274353 RepID=A0ABW4KJD5_9BACI
MFKKHKLQKEFDHRLIDLLEKKKREWDEQKHLLRLSYEPQDELQYRTLMAKSKYLFLLKEARKRNISIKGL